jgi:hypothetical protein
VHVSLTEAGFLKTPMTKNRQVARNLIPAYDGWRRRALAAVQAQEEKAPGADVVARALLEIVESPSPRLRYLIGSQAKSVARLRRFLPAAMYEWGVRRTFSLDETRR